MHTCIESLKKNDVNENYEDNNIRFHVRTPVLRASLYACICSFYMGVLICESILNRKLQQGKAGNRL